jgi:Flp pilus assembly protein TadG
MLFARFFADRKGGVAPLLALGIIPLVGAVGASIDYSRASSARSAMQAAGDAAALMLAKSASGLNASQLQSNATSYFMANFSNHPEAQGVAVTATYGTGQSGFTVTIGATATVQTSFLGILGMSQIPISTSGVVNWNNAKLRVALVLDNTGSMSQGNPSKISALQTASHNLLTQLKNAVQNPGDVYVSIIPFVKDVNGDPTNYNQSWVDWTDWEAPPANSTPPANVGPGSACPWTNSNNGFRCVGSPANNPNCNINGQTSGCVSNIPSSGTYKGYICPSIDSGNRNQLKASVYYNGCYNSTNCTGSGSSLNCQHAWVKNAHSTWNGCMTDRDQNYDTLNSSPMAGALFPAEQYASCPQSAMGLSYDWTALNAKIDAMVAAGNTNQAIGLAWGWQSLTSAPFTVPAKDPNFQYKEIIILLTDGLNTEDRWYTNASQIDSRQATTCANIKAAGITIYTVQVNTGGDPTSTLLQQCATDSNKFFLLTSSNEIVTTFDSIGTSISQLHLAQ